MQSVSKVEILDVQPSILPHPTKTADVNSTVVNINGGSKKTTFRKFAAESALQPKAQLETSLTEQFNAGSLQNDVLLKRINPHTLIHKAILENSPEVIRFLLAQGVSVDYPDKNGMSPLMVALLNRCNYAVDVLLENGANVNPQVKWNNMTLLEVAFYMQDWESTKKLIAGGANVNGHANGMSLLSKAIHMGLGNPDFTEMAKTMINHGADIKAEDIFYALHAAGHISNKNNDISILELMIQRGINLNMEDSSGYCPLIVGAVEQWNPDVIRLFVNSGADINKAGGFRHVEETALLKAVDSGDLKKVKLLVELGADVNKKVVRDKETISPLKLALKKSHPAITQYLLQHGAKA